MTQSSVKILSEKLELPRIQYAVEYAIPPQAADEVDKTPKGLIKAIATTFGPRVTEDGRKFFYTKESFGAWADEMMHGGFKDRPLPIFLNHMSDMLPYGEWYGIDLDEDHMEVSGQIYTNTTFGMDLMGVLMNNPAMLPTVSISAYAESYQMVDVNGNALPDGMEEDGYFQITAGGLREISVVMHAANPKAQIKSVEKFLNDGVNPRYLEKVLRDAGLKKDEAVMVTSVLKKEHLLRDAGVVRNKEADLVSESQTSNAIAILKALDQTQLLDELSKWK